MAEFDNDEPFLRESQDIASCFLYVYLDEAAPADQHVSKSPAGPRIPHNGEHPPPVSAPQNQVALEVYKLL